MTTAEPKGYDELWRDKIGGQDGAVVPRRVAAALASLPGGRRLLDVGCGSGVVALAARGYEELHGVEFSADAVERARSRGMRAEVLDLNAGRLPHPDGHFDAVLFLDVVEHLVEPERLLGDIARVLAPGGQLVVTTPNVRHLRQLFRIAVRGEGPRTSGDRLGIDGGHLHYFTVADVARLCSGAGLEVVETRGLMYRLPERLQHAESLWVVREFLSSGLLVRARKAS